MAGDGTRGKARGGAIERVIGVAGDPFASGAAAGHKGAEHPKEPDYCVACSTSSAGGAREVVAAFGPFCREEASEISAEMQAMDCEGANYYPRRLSPAEVASYRQGKVS